MFSLNFASVLTRSDMIAEGTWLTVQLATQSVFWGFLIGTFCAIGRRSNLALVSRICSVYIEAIRDTPFLVQISLVYFGISSLGLSLSAYTVAIIALTINVGAYTAEITRAGFDSIHRGQWEAAECLGLSKVRFARKLPDGGASHISAKLVHRHSCARV